MITQISRKSVSEGRFPIIVLASALLALPFIGRAQSDPGPRKGAAGAGGAIPGLTAEELAAFTDGQDRFNEIDDVTHNGLGPRFNSTSCVSCHTQPAEGGSSPANNPQVENANASNTLPPFITATGPVREARFIKNSDGTPDGGVHSLFVITGRPDAPTGCTIKQESYSNASNISLRIPTPTFGLGLVEAIPDSALIASFNNTASTRARLGIKGRFNRTGNDGTITRFGWKAQNKSVEIFAGEAYNVEMGVSNTLFQNERGVDAASDYGKCSPVAPPNDGLNLGSAGLEEFSDVTAFASFMRFLAPPTPGPGSRSVTNGSQKFASVGCAQCHTVSLQTVANRSAALSNKTVNAYSDFALHHMGPGLADQISQGVAGGDEFRTAPLWGLGQRLFFLHDGRTSDLLKTIQAHSSSGNSTFPASEANQVVANFNNLSRSDKQDLLNFLRSL